MSAYCSFNGAPLKWPLRGKGKKKKTLKDWNEIVSQRGSSHLFPIRSRASLCLWNSHNQLTDTVGPRWSPGLHPSHTSTPRWPWTGPARVKPAAAPCVCVCVTHVDSSPTRTSKKKKKGSGHALYGRTARIWDRNVPFQSLKLSAFPTGANVSICDGRSRVDSYVPFL